jgi:hypothetical protein
VHLFTTTAPLKRLLSLSFTLALFLSCAAGPAHAQQQDVARDAPPVQQHDDPLPTRFGDGSGEYGQLLSGLGRLIMEAQSIEYLGGRERRVNVGWLRDEVHALKGAKYFAPSVRDFVELFLMRQTEAGFYYDYVYPLTSRIASRLNFFDSMYWHVYPQEGIQMHRLPIEADVEYLAVKGTQHIWQATGDTSFVEKWLPSLEQGLRYTTGDTLRWSTEHQLVKRGYTIDTWDFRQITLDGRTPVTPQEWAQQKGDPSRAHMDIDAQTPMGIFHGDNSGVYEAERLLAGMHRALGHDAAARAWNHEAAALRARANELLWEGDYYQQFVPVDSLPDWYPNDFPDRLSLSNTYDINRGLPTQAMSADIIQTYRDLRSDSTFAAWYTLHPAVKPYFGGHEPGTYVNGGLTTVVAGELAKAAFQHGFEQYGAQILRRAYDLMQRHDGKLPVMLKRDGSADSGAPDNWGQAALVSALTEGLAGVVDEGTLFERAEVSPRWTAAGIDEVENVTVAYGPSGAEVQYDVRHDASGDQITLALRGDAERYDVRLLLPEGADASGASATVNGENASSRIETVRESHYLVVEGVPGGATTVRARW